jgi:hypothetical protein
MPPKYTPNAPTAGRYWPGKAPKEEDRSSSDEEGEEGDEEKAQERQDDDRQSPRQTAVTEFRNEAPPTAPAAKLVTTMKSARTSEQGPYVQLQDESSESEPEDEAPSTA